MGQGTVNACEGYKIVTSGSSNLTRAFCARLCGMGVLCPMPLSFISEQTVFFYISRNAEEFSIFQVMPAWKTNDA